MKKLCCAISAKKVFTLAILLLVVRVSYAANENPIGMVESQRGNTFAVKLNNDVINLTKGTVLYDKYQLVTEEGSELVYSDGQGRKFQLSGAASLTITGKVFELKSGYVYVTSTNKIKVNLQTANAGIEFGAGEFVISYDPDSGKSQLMSVKGNYDFYNRNDRLLVVIVKDGEFSVMDKSFDAIAPRAATPVGFKSFNKVLSLFNKNQSSETTGHGSAHAEHRAPASVEESHGEHHAQKKDDHHAVAPTVHAKTEAHEDEVEVVEKFAANKAITAPGFDLDKFYQEKNRPLVFKDAPAANGAKNEAAKLKKSGVAIKIYWPKKMDDKEVVRQIASRAPSSIEEFQGTNEALDNLKFDYQSTQETKDLLKDLNKVLE
jgi:hypothetical protein